jgi:hypothetical protein
MSEVIGIPNMSGSVDLEFHRMDVMSRIDQIEECLKGNDPKLPGHLAAIHKTLLQFEDLIHMLSDDQIRMFMSGQKKHVNVMLVKEIVSKKVSTAKIPKASADDF